MIIRDLCSARDNHYQSHICYHIDNFFGYVNRESMHRMACMCCYFTFLMYITFLSFCGELHCDFILQIIFVDFVSYCIICNLIVYALYEYFQEANKDYYYYHYYYYYYYYYYYIKIKLFKDKYIFFLWEDDLLTCRNKKNIPRAQCNIIDNISLALMKQFNSFPIKIQL